MVNQAHLWWAIICVALISFAFKAVGPAVLADRQLPAAARGVIALLAPVLLAGLLVVDMGGPRWTALNGPLLIGLATVAAVRLSRAPMLLAILAGTTVTALIRLVWG
ncbi:branched-chain amino acid ABC transporter [Streptomyces dioscori]|uniref:Branched-chain amino acid ABC transporter n=1 Tax=Streptomyces dioscori TaxID=2109333 RepID=A0A2P8QG22_9ACTN|nr:AzlD domain-containing protein [Streptomyces dioscori]PSM45199.1 branched-chain amino acid ABC transporter [Streptomyces dioscori]